jgi:para-nitrobenzyl esterase
VAGFLGVPYAVPLSSQPRFLPATPVHPWPSPLKATTAGPGCPQAGSTAGTITGEEDCLHLDVYTPTAYLNSTTAMPAAVAVYIHGGGFTAGTAGTYDGAALADTYGVVVVCVQYRIGVLGFFQHEALAAAGGGALGGMNGILDTVVALQWIQRNAAVFGGDPSRVTIWGESAGAQTVCVLTVAPAAKGLFRQAIIESGQCTDRGWTGWAPGNVSDGLAAGLHFLTATNAHTVDGLRNASLATLVNTPYGSTAGGRTPPIYYVDNHTFAAGTSPRDAWKAGQLNVRTLLLGFNTADGLVGWPFESYGPVNKSLTQDQSLAILATIFGAVPAMSVLNMYTTALYGRPDAAIMAAYRDEALACPEYQLSSWAIDAGVTTYTYLIGSPRKGGAPSNWPDWPTSYFPHGLELGALFDFTNFTGVPTFMTEETGRRLRNYWMEFVIGGAPRDLSSGGGTPWSPFYGNSSNGPHSPYMYLGPTVSVDGSPGDQLPLPDVARCAFWVSIKEGRWL